MGAKGGGCCELSARQYLSSDTLALRWRRAALASCEKVRDVAVKTRGPQLLRKGNAASFARRPQPRAPRSATARAAPQQRAAAARAPQHAAMPPAAARLGAGLASPSLFCRPRTRRAAPSPQPAASASAGRRASPRCGRAGGRAAAAPAAGAAGGRAAVAARAALSDGGGAGEHAAAARDGAEGAARTSPQQRSRFRSLLAARRVAARAGGAGATGAWRPLHRAARCAARCALQRPPRADGSRAARGERSAQAAADVEAYETWTGRVAMVRGRAAVPPRCATQPPARRRRPRAAGRRARARARRAPARSRRLRRRPGPAAATRRLGPAAGHGAHDADTFALLLAPATPRAAFRPSSSWSCCLRNSAAGAAWRRA
jgi:hypothetical protein